MLHVQIPKDIIYDTSIGEKRILVFTFLCCRKSLDDTVALSIAEICNWSKMKLNRKPGKINDKYLSVLASFINSGYFYDTQNLKSTSFNNFNTYYRLDFNMDKYCSTKHFAIIYFDEIQKVINFKEELLNTKINMERLTSSYMLLVLAYLRVNMNRNTSKPLCCYRLYKKISDDLGISERYVSRIVEVLDVLKIIKHDEMPKTRFKDSNGNWCFNTQTKIFANYKQFNSNGEEVIGYDVSKEIEKQKEILIKKGG